MKKEILKRIKYLEEIRDTPYQRPEIVVETQDKINLLLNFFEAMYK